MEQGLRDCCRSIRIGKILVESDAESHKAKVVYARFPDDISQRQVLLMYPIMVTGNTVIQAVKVLEQHQVPLSSIILTNLFCTPEAARLVVDVFPGMKVRGGMLIVVIYSHKILFQVLTSELNEIAPSDFGFRYFGTE